MHIRFFVLGRAFFPLAAPEVEHALVGGVHVSMKHVHGSMNTGLFGGAHRGGFKSPAANILGTFFFAS